jgi:hypothetical protein
LGQNFDLPTYLALLQRLPRRRRRIISPSQQLTSDAVAAIQLHIPLCHVVVLSYECLHTNFTSWSLYPPRSTTLGIFGETDWPRNTPPNSIFVSALFILPSPLFLQLWAQLQTHISTGWSTHLVSQFRHSTPSKNVEQTYIPSHHMWLNSFHPSKVIPLPFSQPTPPISSVYPPAFPPNWLPWHGTGSWAFTLPMHNIQPPHFLETIQAHHPFLLLLGLLPEEVAPISSLASYRTSSLAILRGLYAYRCKFYKLLACYASPWLVSFCTIPSRVYLHALFIPAFILFALFLPAFIFMHYSFPRLSSLHYSLLRLSLYLHLYC